MKNKFLKDKIYAIETNIDDMSPVIYDTLFEKLYKRGALEAFMAPVYMKKMRPGALLTVLADKNKLEAMAEVLFTETTTFGIRYYETSRLKLKRARKYLNHRWGKVRINEGYIGKNLVKSSPEYSDCYKIASENKKPIKDVIEDIQSCLKKKNL